MNIKIQLPEDVKYIINKLYETGEEAFAVGGSVRDALMGKTPKDWDICTSAEPHIVKKVFEHTADTGIKHGTVTVVLPGGTYEVTTYRIDGEYTDNRHPKKVRFVRSLEEDLKRRDFTINAMAYNDFEGLKDFHGGTEDLKNKLLRCVGEPDKRFNEDALRIMRAVRFSAVLMFDIEPETAKSIRKNKKLLEDIAVERLSAELFKLLESGGYDKTVTEYADVLNVFLYDCNIEKTIGKPSNFRIFALFDNPNGKSAMKRLKFPNKTIADVLSVTQNTPPETLPEARRLYGKIGGMNLKNLLLYHGRSTETVDITEKENLCCVVKDLDIDGKQVIEITGKNGRETGQILNMLLDAVIDNKIKNEYAELKAYILKRKEK